MTKIRQLFSRRGFTLIEMVIFSAILATSFVAFVTILVLILNVQVREQAVAEVNQQSQFLLQTVERLVKDSSAVDIVANTPTQTLLLRMSSGANDPTRIFASGTQVYIQQGSVSPQPLTSSRVSISNLAFTRRVNPPGHDSVAVSLSLFYNTSSSDQFFSQFFNY